MPEQTQAAFGHEHSVFDPEAARAGLPPAVEVDAVEELDGLAHRFGEGFFKHKAILGAIVTVDIQLLYQADPLRQHDVRS